MNRLDEYLDSQDNSDWEDFDLWLKRQDRQELPRWLALTGKVPGNTIFHGKITFDEARSAINRRLHSEAPLD